MNEIEQRFYDAWEDWSEVFDDEDGDEQSKHLPYLMLEPQYIIGVYKVDFKIGSCVVEIDGHEAHKTKEQRYKDYQRERFLQKEGYTVIRFTGSEVYLNPKQCVLEMLEIANMVDGKEIEKELLEVKLYHAGLD